MFYIAFIFVSYKPNPFYHTAHLRPPPSCRLFYELDVQLSLNQSSDDSYGAATPSGDGKSGCVQFEPFDVNESSNFF